jgi:hypothetical protein
MSLFYIGDQPWRVRAWRRRSANVDFESGVVTNFRSGNSLRAPYDPTAIAEDRRSRWHFPLVAERRVHRAQGLGACVQRAMH